MKRIISIVLVLVILFSISCFGENNDLNKEVKNILEQTGESYKLSTEIDEKYSFGSVTIFEENNNCYIYVQNKNSTTVYTYSFSTKNNTSIVPIFMISMAVAEYYDGATITYFDKNLNELVTYVNKYFPNVYRENTVDGTAYFVNTIINYMDYSTAIKATNELCNYLSDPDNYYNTKTTSIASSKTTNENKEININKVSINTSTEYSKGTNRNNFWIKIQKLTRKTIWENAYLLNLTTDLYNISEINIYNFGATCYIYDENENLITKKSMIFYGKFNSVKSNGISYVKNKEYEGYLILDELESGNYTIKITINEVHKYNEIYEMIDEFTGDYIKCN